MEKKITASVIAAASFSTKCGRSLRGRANYNIRVLMFFVKAINPTRS